MRKIGIFLRSSDAKCLRFGLPLRFGLRCERPRCQIASDAGRAMRTTKAATSLISEVLGSECTKIAQFSAVAAAIFTAPEKSRDFLRPQDARFPLRRRSLASRDFSQVNMILAAESPAIASSVVEIASEQRCDFGALRPGCLPPF